MFFCIFLWGGHHHHFTLASIAVVIQGRSWTLQAPSFWNIVSRLVISCRKFFWSSRIVQDCVPFCCSRDNTSSFYYMLGMEFAQWMTVGWLNLLHIGHCSSNTVHFFLPKGKGGNVRYVFCSCLDSYCSLSCEKRFSFIQDLDPCPFSTIASINLFLGKGLVTRLDQLTEFGSGVHLINSFFHLGASINLEKEGTEIF